MDFNFLLFNDSSASNLSFAHSGTTKITRLPLLMPVACQGLLFGWERVTGMRERRKGRESMVYRVVIKVK